MSKTNGISTRTSLVQVLWEDDLARLPCACLFHQSRVVVVITPRFEAALALGVATHGLGHPALLLLRSAHPVVALPGNLLPWQDAELAVSAGKEPRVLPRGADDAGDEALSEHHVAVHRFGSDGAHIGVLELEEGVAAATASPFAAAEPDPCQLPELGKIAEECLLVEAVRQMAETV